MIRQLFLMAISVKSPPHTTTESVITAYSSIGKMLGASHAISFCDAVAVSINM